MSCGPYSWLFSWWICILLQSYCWLKYLGIVTWRAKIINTNLFASGNIMAQYSDTAEKRHDMLVSLKQEFYWCEVELLLTRPDSTLTYMLRQQYEKLNFGMRSHCILGFKTQVLSQPCLLMWNVLWGLTLEIPAPAESGSSQMNLSWQLRVIFLKRLQGQW